MQVSESVNQLITAAAYVMKEAMWLPLHMFVGECHELTIFMT